MRSLTSFPHIPIPGSVIPNSAKPEPAKVGGMRELLLVLEITLEYMNSTRDVYKD
jgi:hypothetical protein